MIFRKAAQISNIPLNAKSPRGSSLRNSICDVVVSNLCHRRLYHFKIAFAMQVTCATDGYITLKSHLRCGCKKQRLQMVIPLKSHLQYGCK